VKTPRKRGTPVDAKRITDWVERFSGYRTKISGTRIEAWLGHFDQPHKDAAARVLDAVEFYGHEQLDSAFRSVLGELPGWHRNAAQRTGRWRFVPFTLSPGESGDSMLHGFRVANKLSSSAFDDLFVYKTDLLRERLVAEDTVVFVDDFAGTGDQAAAAWRESLEELLPGRPRAFLLLVAAIQEAVTRIGSETPLRVRPFRRLKAGDNFFAPECTQFSEAEKRAILSYCRRADATRPRGYGECGLLVVMAHRCPNNSIPILHARSQQFKGLFVR
jgi:hypothetical protein